MTRMERPAPKDSLLSRSRALARRHALVDGYIEDEMQRPMPNTAVLRNLKRRKLELKDEMARIDGLWRTLGRDTRVHTG